MRLARRGHAGSRGPPHLVRPGLLTKNKELHGQVSLSGVRVSAMCIAIEQQHLRTVLDFRNNVG